MSARCEYIWTGCGLEDDRCGEPADEHCEDCEKTLCLEHAERTASGHFKCPACAADYALRARKGKP